MRPHLRANVWLLLLTVLLCCVIYPLFLLAVGTWVFPDQARGSLLRDPDGTIRGARPIAQPFSDPKYFWPRPSAVGYNASASGASNLSANNPSLRDRVARQLGPIAVYARGPKQGQRAGPDIEMWFRQSPDLLRVWAEKNPTLAARWVKDEPNAVGQWLRDHPGVIYSWQGKNPGATPPDPDKVKDLTDELAALVLGSFAAEHPRAWPVPQQRPGPDGRPQPYLTPVFPDPSGRSELPDLQAVLFDTWLQEHSEDAGQLRVVPADLVTTSGSGLDPHITLANARYQLDRVAKAWADAAHRNVSEVRNEIANKLNATASAPLGGMAGVRLIHVLETNLWLRQRYLFSGDAAIPAESQGQDDAPVCTVWLLPALVLVTTILLSIPIGTALARLCDGRYRVPRWLGWVERRFETRPQGWKEYCVAMLLFNVVMFLFGYAVLALQPILPLNPDGKRMLSPTTIFNTVCSFLTNTDLQHYSGEQHLSYFSQVFAIGWYMFVSASVGFCALAAIIRALRGDASMGNYYLDMWRIVAYVFVPISLVMGTVLIADGMPITFEGAAEATTLEPGAMGTGDDGRRKPQVIARGPVAVLLPIKHFGTNGGGFFGANSAHPYENPSALSNFLSTVSILLFPFSLVVMFGRMLNRMRDAAVIYGVMLALLVAMIGWAIWFDTLRPNPAFAPRPAVQDDRGRPYEVVVEDQGQVAGQPLVIPALVGMPVDQSLGNLEGKELRFGTAAGATFAAVTTAATCGSVNCAHDSLNPLASLSPFVGLWLNCVFGGKGVGMINMLIYLVIGVFLAGLMVGRTPEYLGKKVEAREIKLAVIALLVHPILILGGSGLFIGRGWGIPSTSNPGPHGFSQIVYEFSSASANNGSELEGLQQTWGFNDPAANASPPGPYSAAWDIATGLVMLLGRFLPIIAPIAMAASLAAKKPTKVTPMTLRTDTLTFGILLLGVVLLIGALLFLPVAVLGPVAEDFGPIPFGG